jgi:hypothetical protein
LDGKGDYDNVNFFLSFSECPLRSCFLWGEF